MKARSTHQRSELGKGGNMRNGREHERNLRERRRETKIITRCLFLKKARVLFVHFNYFGNTRVLAFNHKNFIQILNNSCYVYAFISFAILL